MEKFNLFLNCAVGKIKNKFFKGKKYDISHACNHLKKIDMEEVATDEEKCIEEYAQNYNITTRWQTI